MIHLTQDALHNAATRRAHQLRDEALDQLFSQIGHVVRRLLAMCHLPRSVEA